MIFSSYKYLQFLGNFSEGLWVSEVHFIKVTSGKGFVDFTLGIIGSVVFCEVDFWNLLNINGIIELTF